MLPKSKMRKTYAPICISLQANESYARMSETLARRLGILEPGQGIRVKHDAQEPDPRRALEAMGTNFKPTTFRRIRIPAGPAHAAAGPHTPNPLEGQWNVRIMALTTKEMGCDLLVPYSMIRMLEGRGWTMRS